MDTLQSADSKTMVYNTIGLHFSLPKALYETRFHWGTVGNGETLGNTDGTGTACQSPQSQPSPDIITADDSFNIAITFSDIARSRRLRKLFNAKKQRLKNNLDKFPAFSQKLGSVLSIHVPENRILLLGKYKTIQSSELSLLAESYPEEAMLYKKHISALSKKRNRKRVNDEVSLDTNLKTCRK
jgi:hypothetical protein